MTSRQCLARRACSIYVPKASAPQPARVLPQKLFCNEHHLQENDSDATYGWQDTRVRIACEVMS